MANRPRLNELEAFFQERTIGWKGMGLDHWTWRGPGYDEGWELPTREELLKLYHLLGDYLMALDRNDQE